MEHFRPTTVALIFIVVVVLTILFLRGIWLRLEWGATGFVAGLLCGALLALEIHYRREHK
jgi:hypothetical protein